MFVGVKRFLDGVIRAWEKSSSDSVTVFFNKPGKNPHL